MEIPKELQQAIDNITKNKTAQLTKSAQQISKRYRAQPGANARLLSTEDEAAAYAASRMPATYAATKCALESILSLYEHPLMSLLDIGAGTGAATWAAQSLIDLQSIVCIEREEAMRRAGALIAREGSPAIQSAKWISQDIAAEEISQKADIVISSYVLNEMSEDTRQKAIKNLWQATNKLLLILEPGTPKNFAQMHRTRQLLLGLGAHIVAPCPHESSCPIPPPIPIRRPTPTGVTSQPGYPEAGCTDI